MEILKYKKERDTMISWLNEQISEDDIIFDVTSRYFEQLLGHLEQNPKIRFSDNIDYFKIRFLWILYKNSIV